jgi:hypothetical protein
MKGRPPVLIVILLMVKLFVAALWAAVVARLFNKTVGAMLNRMFEPDLSNAWHRLINFSIYIVGISTGLRLWALEAYVRLGGLDLPSDLLLYQWLLEMFRTFIDTPLNLLYLLVAYFAAALVAYCIIRAFELFAGRTSSPGPSPP